MRDIWEDLHIYHLLSCINCMKFLLYASAQTLWTNKKSGCKMQESFIQTRANLNDVIRIMLMPLTARTIK